MKNVDIFNIYSSFKMLNTPQQSMSLSLFADRNGIFLPYQYANWQDEFQSLAESCCLEAALFYSGEPTHVSGLDANRFLDNLCCGGVSNLKPGEAANVVSCNEKGNVIAIGMVLCVDEREYDCYTLAHLPQYQATKLNYRLKPIYENRSFVYRISGPRSLEVVENSASESLQDIGHMRFRSSSIDGCPVRILRHHFGGALTYSIQGSLEFAEQVYSTIFREGERFGITGLGWVNEMCVCTELGIPLVGFHFPSAYIEDQDYINQRCRDGRDSKVTKTVPHGSLSGNIVDYCKNPIELGLTNRINWNCDFIGWKALQAIKKENRRHLVTLRWSPEDIIKIFSGYLGRKGDTPKFMEFPINYTENNNGNTQDRIHDQNEKVIGASMGRIYDFRYRDVISLCTIDREFAAPGSKVKVIWGDVGKNQVPVHATVQPCPYGTLETGVKD